MGVRLQMRQGELIAFLEGEIDHHSSARLRASLDKLIETKRPKKLILDFSVFRGRVARSIFSRKQAPLMELLKVHTIKMIYYLYGIFLWYF